MQIIERENNLLSFILVKKNKNFQNYQFNKLMIFNFTYNFFLILFLGKLQPTHLWFG